MRIANGSHIRIGMGEAVTLQLPDGSVPVQRVLIHATHCADIAVDVDSDGSFAFPALPHPAFARCEWQQLPSEETEYQTVAVTFAEVTGGQYFALDELRYYGNGEDDFSLVDEGMLHAARQKAMEVFETNAKRSFVWRYGITKLYRPVSFVTLRHCDVRELVDGHGFRLVSDCQLERCEPLGDCQVTYYYGADGVPARVSKAVLDLAAYFLRPQALPDRAVGEQTEAGFLRYTIAGRDGATGFPEIDAVIDQFGRKRYGGGR